MNRTAIIWEKLYRFCGVWYSSSGYYYSDDGFGNLVRVDVGGLYVVFSN